MVAILLGSLFKRRSKTSMLYYAYWYQWGRCGQRMIELSAEYQCQPRATFITQIQTNRDDLERGKGNPSFFSSPSPILNQLTSHVLFQVNI